MTRQVVPALIAAVLTAACALLEAGPWRADPQTSSVVHVPSEIRLPVRAGDFSLIDWEERGGTPPTAVATYRTQARYPILQISLREWGDPDAVSHWLAAQRAAAGAGDRDPAAPRSEITLGIAIRDQKVDSTGSLVAGDATHSSEVWVAFRQKEYVALIVMLYAAESLSDQDAIERLGDVFDCISWLAPD